MQIETLLSRTSAMLTRIAAHAEFTLSDPTIFNTMLTACLANPAFSLPNGPVVGLCCSSLLSLQFPDPDPSSADDLMTEFRRFLLAISLVRCGWTGEIPQCHLLPAGHVWGYRLIKRLDRIVTPQFLSTCSRESTQVLFLLVLGAALALGSPATAMSLPKETPQSPPPTLNTMADEFVQSPTLYLAMKEKTCWMLAHHLAIIGSKLGIILNRGLEQRILDIGAATWNTMERSVWVEAEHDGIGAADLQPQLKGKGPGVDRGLGEGNQAWTGPSYHWGMEEPPPPLPTFPQSSSTIRSMSPETSQLVSEPHGDWDANPQSYLDMVMEDEPEAYGKPSTTPASHYDWQRSHTDPLPGRKRSLGESRTRRTIWLVRPFDGGSGKGQINQHTRVRGDMENRDFRMYV